MKKTILILLFVLFLSSVSNALDEVDLESYLTYGVRNGRYWNMADKTSKSDYIDGILVGVKMCIESEVLFITSDQKERERLFRGLYIFIPADLTIDDIVKHLDNFYSDALNADVAITWAYTLFTLKRRGMINDEQYNNLLAGYRKGDNKN